MALSAAAGWSSTSGSGARRRKLGNVRCWLSQKIAFLAVAGDRPRLPEQPGSALDLGARHPRHLFNRRRGELPTDLGTQVEGGPTVDLPLKRLHRVMAEDGWLGAVPLVAAG